MVSRTPLSPSKTQKFTHKSPKTVKKIEEICQFFNANRVVTWLREGQQTTTLVLGSNYYSTKMCYFTFFGYFVNLSNFCSDI